MQLTRKQKKSQKSLVTQRNDALASAERAANEAARLQGNIDVLIAERLASIEQAAQARVDAANKLAAQAHQELAAIKVDMRAAAAAEVDKLVTSVMDLTEHIAQLELQLRTAQELGREQAHRLSTQEAVQLQQDASLSALNKELRSLKLEDVKDLRKRLELKTKRVHELEVTLAALTPEGQRLRALAGIRPGLAPAGASGDAE